MKTRAEQLNAQLQRLNQPLPVFMVSGDEPLQHAESCDAIRAWLRQAGFTERDVMHVDAGFAWSVCWKAPTHCHCLPNARSSSCAWAARSRTNRPVACCSAIWTTPHLTMYF